MLRILTPLLQCPCQAQQLTRFLFSTCAHVGRTYYEILGTDKSATAEQIKIAFRQKVKELHPDLNAAYTAADGEAFMQLITAYEVLSDPEKRQLYDIQSSAHLPGALKRAASATAEESHTSSASMQDPFIWRYGLSDWAKYGPADNMPATSDDSSRLRWSVLNALARHHKDLEHDLHAGLLKAFLGPKLEIQPGQLPAAFEADERAHPSLSHDLLHLVHGRTLLGVVRVQQPLQITGGAQAAAAVLPGQQQAPIGNKTAHALPTLQHAGQDLTVNDSATCAAHAGEQTVVLSSSGGKAATATTLTGSCGPAEHHRCDAQMLHSLEQDRRNISADHASHELAAEAALPSRAGSTAEYGAGTAHQTEHINSMGQPIDDHDTADASSKSNEEAAAEAEATAGSDEEIPEVVWRELLQEQHPLRGVYDWMPPAPLQLPATSAGGDIHNSSSVLDSDAKAERQAKADMQEYEEEFVIGGQAAKQAWDVVWQQQHGKQSVAAVDAASGAVSVAAAGCTGEAAQASRNASAYSSSCAAITPATMRLQPTATMNSVDACGSSRPQHQQQDCSHQPQPQHGNHTAFGPQGLAHDEHNGQDQQDLQKHSQHASTTGQSRSKFKSQHQQSGWWNHRQHVQKASQQQCQASWLRQRRLWRWLRSPSPDWSAADWGFDDSSDGALVLQLLLGGGQAAAVAVRDDTQAIKPIKVYLNGVFTVAILDDIIMEPMTGRLMGVLYKYYTPGVHHLYFYLPGTHGSRVLARLQRRWMPPSSTWLFPPVSESHDRGGWVVEWEGHAADSKPGWMHPAVFVLTAGCYSYDMEARKLGKGSTTDRQQQLWNTASELGRRLDRAFAWVRNKWRDRQNDGS